jgi:hypothetical protein
MKVYGMASVSDFIDDLIVYRNLKPADNRLPGLDDLRGKVGIAQGIIPRKNEADYARVVAEILRSAMALNSKSGIERIVFIGDTRLLDSTAFTNICDAGSWRGIAFIGSENNLDEKHEVENISSSKCLFLSNRWAALDSSFRDFVYEQIFAVDERTALLIDLDKTALGARGRNSSSIDNARVQAVFDTVSSTLRSQFNEQEFRKAYDEIIKPEFHPFTEDNQDYVAYLCLILGSGLISFDHLAGSIHGGGQKSFAKFIEAINARRSELPAGLRKIHDQIYINVQAGDPTPYKQFRHNEYRITQARMGFLPEKTPIEKLLKQEIVLTREVYDLANDWKARGALVFGLSDKPDEASLPTHEEVREGCLPLHRKRTHLCGS